MNCSAQCAVSSKIMYCEVLLLLILYFHTTKHKSTLLRTLVVLCKYHITFEIVYLDYFYLFKCTRTSISTIYIPVLLRLTLYVVDSKFEIAVQSFGIVTIGSF